ncbi:hypothetical protein DSCO28_14140 [Desulfosarcina ovata subsp. sediminis]|uniref:Helix-turn-helix domain-containing protein n=1 Tax=Desulfosarcina ovata subsp. sediminis TaxID=885957 RepID=A0A5K7ZFB0_9BACT|nr:helix-turn-helix domain-containing protein [Desulfosarcina ovata]BBO80848.1 hypothetical protein DSCO28_14140 [Desulfosarcina ovata subsp. sediminis]
MKTKDELSVQDVADILKVSKSKIYSMIKSNELQSYRVGRKVRFSEDDVRSYIQNSKKGNPFKNKGILTPIRNEGFVLCGQDIILDILSNYMRQRGVPALRAYIGSYDSLIALYRKQVNVASAHLWDSDTDTYNVPYVRRLLPGVTLLYPRSPLSQDPWHGESSFLIECSVPSATLKIQGTEQIKSNACRDDLHV